VFDLQSLPRIPLKGFRLHYAYMIRLYADDFLIMQGGPLHEHENMKTSGEKKMGAACLRESSIKTITHHPSVDLRPSSPEQRFP
jgi:hypothetical protein